MSANPIYHLKDAYFFEVPKSLWRYDWKSLSEVPSFLTDGHPDVTDVNEFNRALDGKVLIPQPFGELHSLYVPKSGFAISKYMILELVVAAVMVLIFTRVAKQLSSGDPPKGRFANLFEAFLVFLRDNVARPAIDDPPGHGHEDDHALPAHRGDSFVPMLWTLFFFVLGCNLLGMVPWAGSPTASFSVTLALAAVTFLTGLSLIHI